VSSVVDGGGGLPEGDCGNRPPFKRTVGLGSYKEGRNFQGKTCFHWCHSHKERLEMGYMDKIALGKSILKPNCGSRT